MNKTNIFFILSASLLLAPLTSTSAQAWQTVDAYQAVPGLSANASDITSDPTGALIYSVGSVTPDVEGNRTAVVRASADQGATWENLDAYLEPGWQFAHFRAVGADSYNRVFAAGHLWHFGVVNVVWMVRESSDNGVTWGTSDLFEQIPGGRSSCGDVKVSPSGMVFAAGYGGTSAGVSWVVRKRLPGQAAFVTADAIASSISGEARSIGFHPTIGVFVVGRVANVWTVRRSPDGLNWSTVDSFKDGGSTSSAESIVVDQVGTIYVAGRADQTITTKVKGRTTTTIVNNWVVRRSTNGGTVWTVVDRFGALPQGSSISAEGMTVGSGGVIYVAGAMPDSWLVRKGIPGVNGTMTWLTSEEFLVPGRTASAWGITTGLGGSIYATGGGSDSAHVANWVTRKLIP